MKPRTLRPHFTPSAQWQRARISIALCPSTTAGEKDLLKAAGTDLSTIRSQREKLGGGGKPSGPLSFMRVYDQIAAVVKSGGKLYGNKKEVKVTIGGCGG